MSERNDTKTNQYAARVKTRSVKFEIWRIITQLPPNEYVNTPPAKAGGFGLRLKAGSIGPSAD